MLFSEWLLEELERQDMTQAELSRRAGMSRGAISHMIIGRRKPETETCARIARALQLPLDLVMKKAGHLPATSQIESENPYLVEISMLFSNLSKTDQRQIVEIVRTFEMRTSWTE